MAFEKASIVLAVSLGLPSVAAAQSAPPTFTRDIAPIFQVKCESCHRANQMAPMSLVTYEDVRSLYAPVLRHRVLLNFHAESDKLSQDDVLNRVLEAKPAPRE